MTRSAALFFAVFILSAVPAAAQQPDALPPLRMRLRGDTLRLVVPDAFTGAGRLAPRQSPADIARHWADATREHIEAQHQARWRRAALGDTTAWLLPAAPPAASFAGQQPVPATTRGQTVLGQYADLGIQLNALLELRFDQLRNLRCTAGDAGFGNSGCSGGFNPPRIDPQFNVRTGGVVGQRLHVNVDYDTQREFDASNNIQVYYQGLEDEILRRVDVGNVTYSAPPSRFITGGIPANNFGVAAAAQLGALSVGGLFAQQKGNVVKARVFTVGVTSVQPVDRVVADRDFEPGRFFFVRNPRSFPGYPALDILNFNFALLPDTVRVTQVRIYRSRSTIGRPVTETNLTGIQGVALRSDSPQRVGPVAWETLVEGRDFYLDPSGLWFALASRLDQDDYLAVSYVTAAGDTVGTFPAFAVAGRVDTLELIYEPRSAVDRPTFFYEMRNAYRVGSSGDIDRGSVDARLLVAGSERPDSGAATFLELLGLAQTTDASAFDAYNRLFPRGRDPAGGAPLREYFVVLPHLTPLADSTRLSPQFRTDSLYRTPIYLLRTQGPAPLWTMALHYDARGGDSRGTLMLGGFQIRTGSERIMAAGRQLVRNVEYTINYEVGQVTFLNPDSLFPQPTQVSVQFEENQAFAVAPTSLYGIQARYDLGEHGSISALGLMQRQRTLFTRPPLGFEPASNAVMGVAGNFRFEPMRLTQLLDALPLVNTQARSQLTLDAEIATSRPSPNQVGVAYVETFEGESGLFVPLGENNWEFGSRPSSAHAPPGLAINGIDPALGFLDADAVQLSWQNLIPAGSSGNATFQLTAQQIDPSIRTEGAAQNPETWDPLESTCRHASLSIL